MPSAQQNRKILWIWKVSKNRENSKILWIQKVFKSKKASIQCPLNRHWGQLKFLCYRKLNSRRNPSETCNNNVYERTNGIIMAILTNSRNFFLETVETYGALILEPRLCSCADHGDTFRGRCVGVTFLKTAGCWDSLLSWCGERGCWGSVSL